jgi:hypothetical protein
MERQRVQLHWAFHRLGLLVGIRRGNPCVSHLLLRPPTLQSSGPAQEAAQSAHFYVRPQTHMTSRATSQLLFLARAAISSSSRIGCSRGTQLRIKLVSLTTAFAPASTFGSVLTSGSSRGVQPWSKVVSGSALAGCHSRTLWLSQGACLRSHRSHRGTVANSNAANHHLRSTACAPIIAATPLNVTVPQALCRTPCSLFLQPLWPNPAFEGTAVQAPRLPLPPPRRSPSTPR